jgi:hypothetical protein
MDFNKIKILIQNCGISNHNNNNNSNNISNIKIDEIIIKVNSYIN